MVRDLIVAEADLKQARTDILESLFNMGIGNVTFDGDKPIYYSSSSALMKIVDLIVYALSKPSSTVTYSDCLKELYNKDAQQIDKSCTKFVQAKNKHYNARMIFLSLYERNLKEYGEFMV